MPDREFSEQRALKALMRALGVPSRVQIVRVIAETPGSSLDEIADHLWLAGYELEPHLSALCEAGILAPNNDDAWHFSHHVSVDVDDDSILLRFKAGGGEVELQLKRDQL